MATMFEIDKAASDYSTAHDALRQIVARIEAERAEIMRKYVGKLRAALTQAADKKAALKGLIDDSHDQFQKPKTRILHGVKLGLQKGKGKLIIEDEDLTVRLIKKHFPEASELYIRTIEKPNKEAMFDLGSWALRKIGVMVEETGDQVVIKPTDSEIDKLVDALLTDDEPEAA